MSASPKSAVPTLHGELCRKALETIEKIVNDEQAGRITKAQYAYAVDILWSALAGLVDQDFMGMIEAMGNQKKDGSYFTKTYLRKGAQYAKVVNLHDGRVRVELDNGKDCVFDFRDEPRPAYLAREKELLLIDRLIMAGFEEF